MNKTCKKCEEEKQLSDFYKCKTAKDGREGKCIKCRNQASHLRYLETADIISEKGKKRYRNNKDDKLKKSKEWYIKNSDRKGKTSKQWRENNQDRSRELARNNMREYRKRNPEKEKARKIAGAAIRSGELIRMPCEECGSAQKIEAHHDDYSKPLDIRWLCLKHHTDLHRKYR